MKIWQEVQMPWIEMYEAFFFFFFNNKLSFISSFGKLEEGKHKKGYYMLLDVVAIIMCLKNTFHLFWTSLKTPSIFFCCIPTSVLSLETLYFWKLIIWVVVVIGPGRSLLLCCCRAVMFIKFIFLFHKQLQVLFFLILRTTFYMTNHAARVLLRCQLWI